MRPNQLTNFNMQIYGQRGERLYLDEAERRRFLAAVVRQEPALQVLCLVLFYSGCRLSEALALTPDNLRIAEGVICFQTLKRRGLFVREVPVPEWLLARLASMTKEGQLHRNLWPIHRATAWRQIKQIMATADIYGAQATPKGLRHGFGVHAVRCGIPLNLLQKWLGHSQMTTTAIYASLLGAEEIEVAKKMWQSNGSNRTIGWSKTTR
jgi:integrase